MFILAKSEEIDQISNKIYDKCFKNTNSNVMNPSDFSKIFVETILNDPWNKLQISETKKEEIKENVIETKEMEKDQFKNNEDWIKQNIQFEIEKIEKKNQNRKNRLEERKKARAEYPDKTISKIQVKKLYLEKKISKQEHGLYQKIYTLVRNNYELKNGNKSLLQYTPVQPIFEATCYSDRQTFRTLKKLIKKKIIHKIMINRQVRIYLNPFKCHCDKTENDTNKRKEKTKIRQQVIANKQTRDNLKTEQNAKKCTIPNNKLSNLEKNNKRNREYLRIEEELNNKYKEKRKKITNKTNNLTLCSFQNI